MRLRPWLIAFVLVVAPAVARAQAEPAPPGYVPPGHEPEPPPPSPLKWHIAVDARLAVPLASPPPSLPPVGWGAGVQLTRALVGFGRGRFGVGADFAYERLQHEQQALVPFGATTQSLSHMTFAGLLVLDGIFGRVRPWATAGAGLSVAQYRQPSMDPMMPMAGVSADAVVPLVQLALGLGVEITHGVDIGLAGQLDFTFSSLSVGSPPATVFSPGLFALRLDLGFRF